MPHSQYGPKVISFYNSSRWKKAREQCIINHHGRCSICGKRGTEVHHIIPLTDKNVDDPAIATDQKNLQLLCKSCHDAQRRDGDDNKNFITRFDENGEVQLIPKEVDKQTN